MKFDFQQDKTQGKVCQAGAPKGCIIKDWCAEVWKLTNKPPLEANLLAIEDRQDCLKGTLKGDHLMVAYFFALTL